MIYYVQFRIPIFGIGWPDFFLAAQEPPLAERAHKPMATRRPKTPCAPRPRREPSSYG